MEKGWGEDFYFEFLKHKTMSNYQQSPAGKDPELWELAKKRAGFKSHFVAYFIVNVFLWAMWFFPDNKFTMVQIFPGRYGQL